MFIFTPLIYVQGKAVRVLQFINQIVMLRRIYIVECKKVASKNTVK